MSKRCKLVDFNEWYDERYKVTNYKDIDRDKKFTDDGIFSEVIFGSLTDDNIDTVGWIDLGEHYIVNPIMYNHLKRLLGNKFEKMIRYAKVLNKEGEVSLEEEQQQENWEEDDNLGLKEFKERFLEMIDKWGNVNKYPKEYNFIMDNLKYVFINKYPVFNAKLRPASIIENTLTKDEINNYYIFMLRYLDEIKDLKEDYLVQPLMYNVQTFAMEIWNSVINQYLKGKKGWLRKNNLGSRINYSARFVITPRINTDIDKIAIPYVGFAELYKYHLISLIATSKNIDYVKAEKVWRKGSLCFNEELYKYMQLLMKKTPDGLTAVLNRNPTLGIGSMLLLEIDEIKTDYSDLTMSISNNLLSVLAGDYDGDTLNLIPIFDSNIKKSLDIIRPKSLIIDKNNGRFNRKFSLYKDQIIGIHILNN